MNLSRFPSHYLRSLFCCENSEDILSAVRYLLFNDACIEEANFSGCLYLVNEDLTSLDMQYAWNLSERFLSKTYCLDFNTYPAQTILTGTASFCSFRENIPEPWQSYREEEEVGAIGNVPLFFGQHLCGALHMAHRKGQEFNSEERMWTLNLARNIEHHLV